MSDKVVSDDIDEMDVQADITGEDKIAVASIEEDSSEEIQTAISNDNSIKTEDVIVASSSEEANKATNVDGMNVVTFSRKKAKAAQEASSS